MGDYGVKISVDGKAITSTTPEDFVFNSKNENNVKIVYQGSGTVTISGSSYNDIIITHSLGFIPMCLLYTELTPGSGRWSMGIQFTNQVEETEISGDYNYTYVDDTYFKIRIQNNTGSSKTVSFRFYILGDPAS